MVKCIKAAILLGQCDTKNIYEYFQCSIDEFFGILYDLILLNVQKKNPGNLEKYSRRFEKILLNCSENTLGNPVPRSVKAKSPIPTV